MTATQHKDQAEAEATASQEWSDVAKHTVGSLTPADRGWILAFVILFGIFQGSNYLIQTQRQEEETSRSNRQVEYFMKLEDSRSKIEDNRSEEFRRMQEVIKELTQALGRAHEYEGRAQHEARILGSKTE